MINQGGIGFKINHYIIHDSQEKTLDKAFVYFAVFHDGTTINKLLLMQIKSYKKAVKFLS